MVKDYAPYLEFRADKNAPAFLLHTAKDNRFPKRELIAYLKDMAAYMKEHLLLKTMGEEK
jgi:protease II